MKQDALAIQKRLLEGKVFRGGASWRKLEKFLGKSRILILEELSLVATREEIDRIEAQIEANEFYQKNVRVVDPEYLKDSSNVEKLLMLNSKLYTVETDEPLVETEEVMNLNMLSRFKDSFSRFSVDENLTKKEKRLFAAYDYFNNRGKNVIILTSEKDTHAKAESREIKVRDLGKI